MKKSLFFVSVAFAISAVSQAATFESFKCVRDLKSGEPLYGTTYRVEIIRGKGSHQSVDSATLYSVTKGADTVSENYRAVMARSSSESVTTATYLAENVQSPIEFIRLNESTGALNFLQISTKMITSLKCDRVESD